MLSQTIISPFCIKSTPKYSGLLQAVETIVKDEKASKIERHNEKILHDYFFIEEKASYCLCQSPSLIILMRLLFRK